MEGTLTRRQFLGSAAGAMSVALPLSCWRLTPAVTAVVLDLREQCSLKESLAGYESALASAGTRCRRVDRRAVPSCPVLIVPAAVRIAPWAVQAIATRLEAGATVLLESGAAFATEPDLRAHRDVLRDSLAVRIERPVPLWPRPAHSCPPGLPYVDYTWPHSAKLRDFSRVVPLGRQDGEGVEIIAWVDGLPVALKRQLGRGTLIFLGSPLGPALWTGETEARGWFFRAYALPEPRNGTARVNCCSGRIATTVENAP